MEAKIWIGLLLAAFLSAGSPAGADVIWDSTFDDPGLLGLEPPASGPLGFPTFLRVGQQTYTVVASSGTLGNQPLEVIDVAPFDLPKVRYDLWGAGLSTITSGSVLVEFDMLIHDVPGVTDECATSGNPIRCQQVTIARGGSTGNMSIRFRGDGLLDMVSQDGGTPDMTPIAFNLGEARHFTVLTALDAPNPGHTVWVDGELLGTVDFGSATPEWEAVVFAGHISRDYYAFDNVFIEQDPLLAPECSDGLDNDGDGFIDHPSDLGCFGPSDPDEQPLKTSCGLGAELVLPLLGLLWLTGFVQRASASTSLRKSPNS